MSDSNRELKYHLAELEKAHAENARLRARVEELESAPLDEATVRRVLEALRAAGYGIVDDWHLGHLEHEQYPKESVLIRAVLARLCPKRRTGKFVIRDPERGLGCGEQWTQERYRHYFADANLLSHDRTGHVEDDYPDAEITWEDDDGE